MQAVSDRNTHAMRLLFDRYAPSLCALSGRILGDRDEAEEVVNEVFLELWQKADRFVEQRGSVRTYLLLLTRSRSIDRARRKSNPRSKAKGNTWANVDVAVSTSQTGPQEQASLIELRGTVKALLDGMPDDQRAAIELAFFEGMSHSEIAKQTGEPLGTIKGRIRLGLTRLRDGLEAHYQGGVS